MLDNQKQPHYIQNAKSIYFRKYFVQTLKYISVFCCYKNKIHNLSSIFLMKYKVSFFLYIELIAYIFKM